MFRSCCCRCNHLTSCTKSRCFRNIHYIEKASCYVACVSKYLFVFPDRLQTNEGRRRSTQEPSLFWLRVRGHVTWAFPETRSIASPGDSTVQSTQNLTIYVIMCVWLKLHPELLFRPVDGFMAEISVTSLRCDLWKQTCPLVIQQVVVPQSSRLSACSANADVRLSSGVFDDYARVLAERLIYSTRS